MKKIKLVAILALFAFLLFGCILTQGDQPQEKLTGAGFSDKNYNFGNFSLNTTSSAYTLNGIYSTHAYQIIYNCPPVNVTMQGSIDYTNWFNLNTTDGNTSALIVVLDKPVYAVRFVVANYMGSTNSSVNNLTIRYIGTS